MAPTQKEIENGIERMSRWLGNSIGLPFKYINKVQNFNNSFKKSTSDLSEELKLQLFEKNKSLQLYYLEKELILVESRIREMKEQNSGGKKKGNNT